MHRSMTASGAPPTVETKSLLVQSVGRRDFSHANSFRRNLQDRPFIALTTMDSQRWIDTDQDVDVVRHDLGLEQDAVRFLSNFGTDLFEPPLDAIDQYVGPIFPTKDHVVPTRKDHVALRSGRHPGIHGNGLYNHQEGRAFLPMAKAKGFARASR
jgi:hypothetical protein